MNYHRDVSSEVARRLEPFILRSAESVIQVFELERQVIAGSGLTGGGYLTGDVTLNVGAGTLITVAADSVGLSSGSAQYQVPVTGATPFTPAWTALSTFAGTALNFTSGAFHLDTPGTLSVASANQAVDAHTHAITTSSNPGAVARILATDVSGYLTLVKLNTDTLADRSGGNLTISPAGDVVFDPAGNDILPVTNYDLNLGMLSKKYLTLHAAELWVETLVAQDTLATIGGQILVAPTTVLTVDFTTTNYYANLNNSFETAGGGGADVFANWTESAGDGQIIRDNTNPLVDTYSCKLVSGPTFNTFVINYTSLEAGKRYYCFFGTRGDGTYAGRYAIYDGTAAAYIISPTSTGVTGTGWTWVYFSFTVPSSPSGAHNVGFGLYGPSANGGTAWFDWMGAVTATISTKHNNLAVGDVAYLEANAKIEFMSIQSGPTGTGPYLYNVDRNLDGTGVNDWYAGDAVLNTGAAGDGFIDLYSVRGVKSASQAGPTIVGNVRNSATFNDWSEAWAIGNLNGLYGYGADTYGVGLGKYSTTSAYMTLDPTNGVRMYANNAQKVSIANDGSFWFGASASTERLAFDTTNGLRIFDHANAAVIQFDVSGNADITGILKMRGVSSAIALGTTPPTSTSDGTGVWIDRSGLYGILSSTIQVRLDATTGAITAGAGVVALDAAGIKIGITSAYADIRAYQFVSGTTTHSAVRAFVNASANFSELRTYPISGKTATTALVSSAPSGKEARSYVYADTPGANARLDVYVTAADVRRIDLYATWVSLDGSLSADGNINTLGMYTVDDIKVVGNRVIDARCDDAINSGDATTDGVIDALRDAMINHGLIAAS